MLQIGAALLFYKSRQKLLQIGAASLLQTGASIVTNWDSYYNRYYKLGQLLQIGVGITNQGNYYKLGHNTILIRRIKVLLSTESIKSWLIALNITGTGNTSWSKDVVIRNSREYNIPNF